MILHNLEKGDEQVVLALCAGIGTMLVVVAVRAGWAAYQAAPRQTAAPPPATARPFETFGDVHEHRRLEIARQLFTGLVAEVECPVSPTTRHMLVKWLSDYEATLPQDLIARADTLIQRIALQDEEVQALQAANPRYTEQVSDWQTTVSDRERW